MVHPLESLVIRHTHRLPAPCGPAGQGDVAALRFDAALMSVGFQLSADLLERLSGLSEAAVADTAVRTLDSVRETVGDHVEHNVYFLGFPADVPDTFDFWTRCIAEALADDASREGTLAQLRTGVADLLTLPSYGTYPHTYAEMPAAHEEFAERKRRIDVLDAETRRRLPEPGHLLIDPGILDVALPLSGRATTGGFGVLPRGSLSPVDGELLRFFVHWKQRSCRTDYDLSAVLLDADHAAVCRLSYTALTEVGGEHSGDVTEAPDGASEFIDPRLDTVRGTFIVPQVNIYAGEGFEAVEESFFGFMLRDAA